ncbi:MAG: hypothetical protein WD749_03705 [Phycisphaerales bacterium]
MTKRRLLRWSGLACLIAILALVALTAVGISLRPRGWRFGPFEFVEDASDEIAARLDRARARDDDRAASPFEDVRWSAEGRPAVMVGGLWCDLLAVDGCTVEDLMAFARKEWRDEDKARRRFEQDLPMLLRICWERPGETAALTGRAAGAGPAAPPRTITPPITEENRARLWEKRAAGARAVEQTTPGPPAAPAPPP